MLVYPSVIIIKSSEDQKFPVVLTEVERKHMVAHRLETSMSQFLGYNEFSGIQELSHSVAHAVYSAIQACLADGLMPGYLNTTCYASTSIGGVQSSFGDLQEDDSCSMPFVTVPSHNSFNVGISKKLQDWLLGE